MQEAWPFLISSSPHSDFRVVVAPEFITQANATREIIRASDDSFRTEDGQAIYLRGYRKGVGIINIVLRARTYTARMLGKNMDEQLLDKAGRPVWVSEGIVLREEGKEPFTAAQLDVALERSRPHFARFLKDKDGSKWEPVPMDAFPLPEAKEGESLDLTYKQSPTLPQTAPTTIEQRTVPQQAAVAAYSKHPADSEAEKKTSPSSTPSGNQSWTPSPSHIARHGTDGSGGLASENAPKTPESSDFGKAFSGGVVYVLGAIISAGLCVALFVPVMALKVIGTVVAVFGTLMFLKSLR